MAAVLTAIEDFCKAHEYTIAAASAVGTCLAVVVSLGIAIVGQRANRTRVSASAAIMYLTNQKTDRANPPSYLTVRITNDGLLPVVIPAPFCFWKVPLKPGLLLTLPWDYGGDAFIGRKQYPVKIEARHSELFVLSDINMFRETFRSSAIDRHATLLDRLCLLLCRAYVTTADGKTFQVRLDKPLREELRKVRKSA